MRGRGSGSVGHLNTTTCLPVDGKLWTRVKRSLPAAWLEALSGRSGQMAVDVLFVSERELDRCRRRFAFDGETSAADLAARERPEPSKPRDEADEGPEARELEVRSIDLLGVYIRHDPELHRPIVKVSPEKVMRACLWLRAQQPCYALADIYPVLLGAVVGHELAHALMDEPWHDQRMHWDWFVEVADDRPWLRFHAPYASGLRSGGAAQWPATRHVIEESLANAFVLRQRFPAAGQAFLRDFMARQPTGYRAGPLWTGDLDALRRLASGWEWLKRDAERGRWSFLFEQPGHLLQALLDQLSDTEPVAPVDFIGMFHRHLDQQVDGWQLLLQQQGGEWDERLNGSFGALDVLTSFDRVGETRRLVLLRQWAGNGSAEGEKRLRQALAEPESRAAGGLAA
jgi:hypothetical protein